MVHGGRVMSILKVTPEYKIILLGEFGVGKTSIFRRLREREGDRKGRDRVSEEGCDQFEYKLVVDGTDVKVNLHDTGGMERQQRTMTANYFRNSDAAILVYSIEDSFTFESLQEWIDQTEGRLDHYKLESLVWAIFGNKIDLPIRRQIKEERVQDRCDQLNTPLSFYVSAETGENVVHAFEQVITHLYKERQKEVEARSVSSSQKVTTNVRHIHNRGGCRC